MEMQECLYFEHGNGGMFIYWTWKCRNIYVLIKHENAKMLIFWTWKCRIVYILNMEMQKCSYFEHGNAGLFIFWAWKCRIAVCSPGVARCAGRSRSAPGPDSCAWRPSHQRLEDLPRHPAGPRPCPGSVHSGVQ